MSETERPDFTRHEDSPQQNAPQQNAPERDPLSRQPPDQQSSSRADSPESAKKRSRAPIVALVVVVLLIAGLIIGDRVGNHLAEQRVATSLQTELNTPDQPSVQIQSIPFLTQLASRHYGQVDIQAKDVPAAANGLALTTLNATLHDVRGDSGYKNLTIAQVDGTATFGYASLSKAIGQSVSYAGKGSSGRDQVKFTVSGAIFGQNVSATIVGAVQLDVAKQGISIADPAVTVAGVTIPQNTASQLIAQMVPPITVKDLPLGVKLQSIAVAGTGVTAKISGQNVTVTTR